MNAVARCFEWLTSRERRKAERRERLPLVAHYWDGGAPIAHEVRDISRRGLYLSTEQRWYPGTLVMLTLQREDLSESHPDRSITIRAKVIRSDAGGVGFSFVMPEKRTRLFTRSGLPSGADKKSFERFLGRLRANRG